MKIGICLPRNLKMCQRSYNPYSKILNSLFLHSFILFMFWIIVRHLFPYFITGFKCNSRLDDNFIITDLNLISTTPFLGKTTVKISMLSIRRSNSHRNRKMLVYSAAYSSFVWAYLWTCQWWMVVPYLTHHPVWAEPLEVLERKNEMLRFEYDQFKNVRSYQQKTIFLKCPSQRELSIWGFVVILDSKPEMNS